MSARDYLLVYLNGQPLHIRGADAFLSLSDFLRHRKSMTGTKIVCSEGDCGACTVLVGRPRRDPSESKLKYEGIDSCILFMHQLDGTHVVSVEGLSPNDELHPVQQAMVDCFGSQCGFCTPGFVGAMVAKVESLPHDADPATVTCDEWKLALTGNLCRCTGYVQILEAAAAAAGPSGRSRIETLYPSEVIAAELRQAAGEVVHLSAAPRIGSDVARELLLPVSIQQALEFKSQQPTARIVNGATDVGVLTNKGRIAADRVLSLAKVQGYGEIEVAENGEEIGVRIGMRATWAAVEAWAQAALPEFYNLVIRFGSPQIRAAGTMVGNVANGSPIGDSLPLLFVMEADLELSSIAGVRRVKATEFYRAYKDFDLRPDELITAIHLPLPEPQETLRLFKVSKRNDLDISTFTAAVRMTIDDQTIAHPYVAYGGVGPTVVRLPKTESFLDGSAFTEDVFRSAGAIARDEITPISDVRGSADYRFQLAENILLKFFHTTTESAIA